MSASTMGLGVGCAAAAALPTAPSARGRAGGRGRRHGVSVVRRGRRVVRATTMEDEAWDPTQSFLRRNKAPLRWKVGFFSATPGFMKAAKEKSLVESIPGATFFDVALGPDTAYLARGMDAVCLFVNDECGPEVVDLLADLGVKAVLMRCAGFDRVNLDACARRGVTVANVPAYSPEAVAEFAVSLCLALNRKIIKAAARVREGNFALNGLVGFDMHGKTVGVMGTGRIGAAACRIYAGFGCKVLAYDAYENEALKQEIPGLRYVGLDEILASSVVLSLHLPLNDDTYHVIDDAAIAKMEKRPIIVNVGRGGLIDTDALLRGLKSRKLRGVGLDVIEGEAGMYFQDWSDDEIGFNDVADSSFVRLSTFPNVILTPHVAFLTDEALEQILSTTAQNAAQIERGEPVKNEVKKR